MTLLGGDDGLISFNDVEVDRSVLESLMADCDEDNNEVIDGCELFICYVRIENEYRTANCPGYALSYCHTPYTCECNDSVCDLWNCEEIK